ncbi:2-amino-4-hydroxy-6-hydroxymethyldihydropteridine diphosphokinase [Marinicella sp. W31]|uniref:2-amino-4-hydroxy-6- hydroxymethyldihydropteridine diphosphokinase n=1 Tax=Marinicella sp. W31 TaxID=3023713 RepID=UPI003757C3E2
MKSLRVFLGLGSNVKPLQHLQSCQQYLNCSFKHIRYSSVYRSPAFGFDGADFLNMVAEITTAFSPMALKHWLQKIEDLHGRDRSKPRYSDRTLDIDLLFYGQHIIKQNELYIPRQEITQRDYVLKPLAELAPDWVHPQHKKKLSTLWKAFSENNVVNLQRLENFS